MSIQPGLRNKYVRKNWLPVRRKNALHKRAGIIRSIRNFFTDSGYLEVETPHRIPAPAPESHIDALPSGSWFLHTSPELCMKRLLSRGYERIFQICRCWRDGERGNRHIPEFTLLEWYRSESNYMDLMEECEALFQHIAKYNGYGERIQYRNQVIDLSSPWKRIKVKEAFEQYGRISMMEALERSLFDEIMVFDIEPRLGIEKPVFIYDYPSKRRALARLRKDDPGIAERFELYIGGIELANGFSELRDPEEQLRCFHEENEYRRLRGKPVYPIPEKFLAEIKYMPESAGIALGIDRLVMIFLNADTIDEVLAFSPEEL